MNEIPTEADWRSEPWDLDTSYAYKHFAGKSGDEAFALFERCALTYQEDLMWMPRSCFQFYFDSYLDYLESETAAGDSDGASCLFDVIVCRRKDIILIGEPLLSRVIAILGWLPAKQDWFDADTDVYGPFETRSKATLKKLRKAIGRAESDGP